MNDLRLLVKKVEDMANDHETFKTAINEIVDKLKTDSATTIANNQVAETTIKELQTRQEQTMAAVKDIQARQTAADSRQTALETALKDFQTRQAMMAFLCYSGTAAQWAEPKGNYWFIVFVAKDTLLYI